MQLLSGVSLKPFNTFGIDVSASGFVTVGSAADFQVLREEKIFKTSPLLILGGGSNILFTADFKGLVIKNEMKGIEILSEDENTILVKVAAGENWHGFVLWCVNRNYGGLENLSLIPGCVGAAPMQNIGAYGVEIKDCCEQVFTIDIQLGNETLFSNPDCRFAYRESIFKKEAKGRYLVTAVSFRLQKKPVFNTSYGAIEEELKRMEVKEMNIKAISEAIINIRSSKLPDPKMIGNAGSFFKNPEVGSEKEKSLRSEYPALVSYPLPGGNYKLAAGWLIEQCGLKGKRKGEAGVHTKQALVLVNYGQAKGNDIYDLSCEVLEAVRLKFGVTLEREVNIY